MTTEMISAYALMFGGFLLLCWRAADLLWRRRLFIAGLALFSVASLASELPFVIVRSRAKEYGTANRIEGAFDYGDCVCLVEDVVTSGGAAIEAVQALREAGLRVSNAVCVLDREEGGVDELARHAVRLRPLYRASELLQMTGNRLR